MGAHALMPGSGATEPGIGVSNGAAAAAAGSRRERSGKARDGRAIGSAWRPAGPPLKTYGKFSHRFVPFNVVLRLMRYVVASVDA
jgi:hypothetical protein